ncbi:glycoside hydrolase family 43, partial [Mesorhizobium sp. M2C.T.Ca.TU.009.01.2.1]
MKGSGSLRWLFPLILIALAAAGYYAWQRSKDGAALPQGIASGNGRIEAVEIDISTKAAGRIK